MRKKSVLMLAKSACERFVALRALALFSFVLFLPLTKPVGAQVAVSSIGIAITQSFDSLPATGAPTWVNNTTLPGWYHQRTAAGATIIAGSGTSATGGLYSFGTGAAAERALGAVSSGATGGIFYGVRLRNQTGATITSLRISYVGEQWRRAATTAPAAQTVTFSYLAGSPVSGSLAEFQSAGTSVPQLDFTSPITALPTGALDGNAAANRTALSHTITGLNIANNAEIMLRWSDIDHADFDHGLAIDDFSVTALSETNLTLTAADTPDPVVAGSNIAYTINANNLGPNSAPNAVMTTNVPANTSFVSLAFPAGWSCTTPLLGAAGAISCTALNFATATSAQFDLVVTVAPGTPDATSIPASFAITSDLIETVSGNETANTATLVNALFLSVTPSAGANGAIAPSTVQSIPYNGTTVFTVTPNPGFTSSVGGTCGGALVGTTYTINAVTSNCTVIATFTPIVYVVTPSAGANGAISPNAPQNVNSGSTTTFTVTPNAGFSAAVGGTCSGSLVGTTYTTAAITANCTVSATFTPIVYVVTPSAGANGSISPSGVQTINSGAITSFTVTPNAGFSAAVSGTCGGALVGTTYTTTAVTANCTVIATFSPIVYSVTPSAGANGAISPNAPQNVNSGSTTTFTVTPNAGFSAAVGGTCGGSLVGTTYTTAAITANCAVIATFTPIVYTVTPSAGANGAISPNAPQNVNSGSTTTFTVTPNAGFSAAVGGTCSGSLVGTTYTTAAITTNCTVSATFTPIVYTVTPSAGANGAISPNAPQNVNSGSTTTFTVTPNAGFSAAVGGTCGGSLVGTTYTTTAITAHCTVIASFSQITYTVTPSAGTNGTITPSVSQTINSGASTVFTVTPNPGFTANVGGSCGGTLAGTTYTSNAITANCTVTASFIPIVYTVMPSAGANGAVSPNTVQSVNSGATTSFTFTPNAGYATTVNSTCGGTLVGALFTTDSITGNCTVAASFSRIPLLPQTITNFTPPATLMLAPGASFALSATGGASNNPVTFSSTSPLVCTVSGTTVTVVAAGVCQLSATQAGNSVYESVNANASVQIRLPDVQLPPAPVPALAPWAQMLLFISVALIALRTNTLRRRWLHH